MPASASVLTAATTLVEWAHQRRRHWTEEPLRTEPHPQVAEARQIEAVQHIPEVPELADVVEETPVFFAEHAAAQDVTPLPHFAEAFESSAVSEISSVPAVPAFHEPEIHEHALEAQELPEVSLAHVEIDPPVDIERAGLFASAQS